MPLPIHHRLVLLESENPKYAGNAPILVLGNRHTENDLSYIAGLGAVLRLIVFSTPPLAVGAVPPTILRGNCLLTGNVAQSFPRYAECAKAWLMALPVIVRNG
jgi:hypothetical protein